MNRAAAMLLPGVFLAMGCQSESKPAPAASRQVYVKPDYRTETIGYSVQKRPIERIVFPGDPNRVVLIMAAIHGNEQAGVDIARGVFETLRADRALAHGKTVVILPIANPDGFANNSRLNANRVDLNRDFPARNFKPGPRARTPLTEPESAAIARQIQEFRPRLLVSIHSIDRKRQCNNYDGPAQSLAEAMSRENGYPAIADIGYPVPGSLGSWAGKELQIPMITLELPSGMNGADAWRTNRTAMLAALAMP